MVTGLPVDIKNDVIVACPHCGNMAERDVLLKWLEKEKICPVCRKNVTVDDVPIVLLKG